MEPAHRLPPGRVAVPVLPDVLEPGLKLVFCGSAAGKASARAGAYYAHPGNRFWRILFETGLTPHLFQPGEFATLPEYGIGLTDMGKDHFGADHELPRGAYDPDGFRDRITKSKPALLAFTAKAPARAYLRRHVEYGPQPERIGDSRLFVLPSTSGLAVKFWNPQYWHDLAECYRSLS